MGQRDPLVEYRSESQKLFAGLQRTLRQEVMKILLNLTAQDIAPLSDDDYNTELTKLAEASTEKGVNEVSSGVENMDKEFRHTEGAAVPAGHSGSNTNKNAKRNAARKAKKKSRQNKKKGRR